MISKCDIEEYVTIIDAPLMPFAYSDKQVPWYKTEVLSKATENIPHIDLLLIDGPITKQTYSRFPALVYFRKLLDKNSLIILDDINRPEETAVLKAWQTLFCLHVEIDHSTKHGLALIQLKE